jgi:membrane-bound metal-dependent hydrolase YbcI (DUF457 family)
MITVLVVAILGWIVFKYIIFVDGVGHRTLAHSCASVVLACIGLLLGLGLVVAAAGVGGWEGWLQP